MEGVWGAVGARIAVGVPPADRGHFAAGVDVGHDAGTALDMDMGVHHTSSQDVDGVLGVALAAAEYVADGVVVVHQHCAVVGTDGGEVDNNTVFVVSSTGGADVVAVSDSMGWLEAGAIRGVNITGMNHD